MFQNGKNQIILIKKTREGDILTGGSKSGGSYWALLFELLKSRGKSI